MKFAINTVIKALPKGPWFNQQCFIFQEKRLSFYKNTVGGTVKNYISIANNVAVFPNGKKKIRKKSWGAPRSHSRCTGQNPLSSIHALLLLLRLRKLISQRSKLAELNRWKPWVIARHFITATRMKAIYQNNTRRIKKLCVCFFKA